MSREQQESGQRWISARLSVLAASRGVTLTGIDWGVDEQRVHWLVARTPGSVGVWNSAHCATHSQRR